jgi:hypothetical protein
VSSDGPQGDHPTVELNPAEVLAAVGEALYVWDIGGDGLTWTANAADVLKVADRAAIATGRTYVQILDPRNTQARFDAVVRSDRRDDATAYPTASSTACARPPARKRCGSRTPAAGSPVATASPRAPSAPCASSTIVTRKSSASSTSPDTTS